MLKLSQSDFSTRKKRGTLIPLVITFAIHQTINLNWLLTGEGQVFAKEGSSEAEDPELAGLIALARKVLTSGNQQAFDALEKNIRYFAYAIDVERRLNDMEKRLIALEQLLKKKGLSEGDPGGALEKEAM